MEEGSVCVANITRSGRWRRTVLGAVVLVATLAAWFVWRPAVTPLHVVALFPPLFFGWLCLMQAAANT